MELYDLAVKKIDFGMIDGAYPDKYHGKIVFEKETGRYYSFQNNGSSYLIEDFELAFPTISDKLILQNQERLLKSLKEELKEDINNLTKAMEKLSKASSNGNMSLENVFELLKKFKDFQK